MVDRAKRRLRAIRWTMRSLAATVGGVALLSGGIAFALQAGGSSPSQIVGNARPGSTITLPASRGETLSIVNRTFNPAIRIDASAAQLEGILIRNSSGVTISGGTIVGPGGRSYGINVVESRHIRVENMTITGAHRGIVIGDSTDISVIGNQLARLLAEGVNIARSQRILVQRNECSNFSPTGAIFAADGTRIQDGDHADCIQAWSRPGRAPTGDVRILNNRATGQMQGIFFGNHVRNGVDDGGFDRVTISGNVINVDSPHGVSLYGGRNSRVTGNRISTIPGARSPRPPHNPVVATLRVLDSSRTTVCGNVVTSRPTQDGTAPCTANATIGL